MEDTRVLIVGAGPTGLTLAIELARRAVPFRLVDRNPAPLPWDRATVVKPRTLEIMDTLGLADAFLERGQKITNVDLYREGERVASMRFSDLDSTFPFLLAQPESESERILIQELERLGGIVERDIALVGLNQDGDSVTATLRRHGAEETASAEWLVGTDGLHSVVREAVGDAFEGHDNPMLWGVVDGTLRGWAHSDHHIAAQMEKPSANPIPLADGRWRMYFRPESPSVDEIARVEAGLAEMSPGAAFVSHDEPQFFHTHSRVAARYRVGRVFLAGDAAHACSPIQGHGLNSGVHDAHNLGWKLALAASGMAAGGLLDTYEQERRPIAQLIVESGEKAERAFVRQDPDEKRRMIAELADEAGNRRAAEGEAEIFHNYGASPIVVGAEAWSIRRRSVGCATADVTTLATARGGTSLYRLLGSTGFNALAFPQENGEDVTLASAVDTFVSEARSILGPHGRVWRVLRPGCPAADDDEIQDVRGELRHRVGGGAKQCLTLVRPDGFVALSETADSPEKLRSLFRKVAREAAFQ